MVEVNSLKLGRQETIDDFSEITLRPFDLTDIDDFMVWASEDKVSRYTKWDTCTSKEDGINYIKNTILPHPWYRAICLKNRPIGAISVTTNSGGSKCRGEIGCYLVTKYWGKGIATRVVKMAVATIFSELPHLERLEAFVAVDHLGSEKMIQKAGFLREGVLRKFYIVKGREEATDHTVFSLLSTRSKI